MEFFYVSSLCSPKKFANIYHQSKIKPQQQAQKFHYLFIKGLELLNNKVYIMSVLPINRRSFSALWVKREKESNGDLVYEYLPILNYPFIKHIIVFFSALFSIFSWSIKNMKNKKVLICDVLNVTSSISALIASKLLGIQSVAIITDLPGFMINNSKKKSVINRIFDDFYIRISRFYIYRFDGYILLTEQMNEMVNPKNKPFVVIEGMVDIEMKEVLNKLENKYDEKIIIYAGALFEKYGVKRLLDAFMKVDLKEARLWIFGSGELENHIGIYEKADNRIKFFGMVPNEEVVNEEMRATLLVNPRPSTEEFTKFSFPSKNMEYMASGTPLLTTKLPGMKNEYYDFIYLIDDENELGIAEALQMVLRKSKYELFYKGLRAKEFVLKEKSNIQQVKRFMDELIG